MGFNSAFKGLISAPDEVLGELEASAALGQNTTGTH